MKFNKFAWMVSLLTVLLTAQVFAADIKIGVIDFQKVLRESKSGKAAKAEIEKKGKSVESSLVGKGKALEAEKKKLEAEAMVMNADARETKAREFKIKIMDFQALQKKSAEDFKDYEMEIIRKVQKDVFSLVESIGKSGNYTLILEKSAALYNPNGIDITDQLIKMYDKK
ncbi:OmpH family outer membrane protein [Desulfococcus sp.]|uniref:OmpH family outer membrane protein n=1 Tax=Desulfococcus sp. TaxID=2025834 RepID=UPI003593A09B